MFFVGRAGRAIAALAPAKILSCSPSPTLISGDDAVVIAVYRDSACECSTAPLAPSLFSPSPSRDATREASPTPAISRRTAAALTRHRQPASVGVHADRLHGAVNTAAAVPVGLEHRSIVWTTPLKLLSSTLARLLTSALAYLTKYEGLEQELS